MIDFRIDILDENYIEDHPTRDGHKNINIILRINKIHKLADLAKDYLKWSFELNCIRADLCSKIIEKKQKIYMIMI